MIASRSFERSSRIENPRTVRAATAARKVRASRARYTTLVRVFAALFCVLALLMGYVVLTSSLTGLSYAVARARGTARGAAGRDDAPRRPTRRIAVRRPACRVGRAFGHARAAAICGRARGRAAGGPSRIALPIALVTCRVLGAGSSRAPLSNGRDAPSNVHARRSDARSNLVLCMRARRALSCLALAATFKLSKGRCMRRKRWRSAPIPSRYSRGAAASSIVTATFWFVRFLPKASMRYPARSSTRR